MTNPELELRGAVVPRTELPAQPARCTAHLSRPDTQIPPAPLAPVLGRLRAKVSGRWPERMWRGDGWHSTPVPALMTELVDEHVPLDISDHVTRALDLATHGIPPAVIVAAALHHPAVKTVSWEGSIWRHGQQMRRYRYFSAPGAWLHIGIHRGLVDDVTDWRLDLVDDDPIAPGATGVHVREAQAWLIAGAGYALTVTGTYDDRTVEAVMHLQESAGLRPTGTFENLTRAYLRRMAIDR